MTAHETSEIGQGEMEIHAANMTPEQKDATDFREKRIEQLGINGHLSYSSNTKSPEMGIFVPNDAPTLSMERMRGSVKGLPVMLRHEELRPGIVEFGNEGKEQFMGEIADVTLEPSDAKLFWKKYIGLVDNFAEQSEEAARESLAKSDKSFKDKEKAEQRQAQLEEDKKHAAVLHEKLDAAETPEEKMQVIKEFLLAE